MSENGGPWTRHGHPVAGITITGTGRPPVARCGGPRLCVACRSDERVLRAMKAALTDPGGQAWNEYTAAVVEAGELLQKERR